MRTDRHWLHQKLVVFARPNGRPGSCRNRVGALTDTVGESNTLSTACMILDDSDITDIMAQNDWWPVILNQGGNWPQLGNHPLPPVA